jgi:hypothetical protein
MHVKKIKAGGSAIVAFQRADPVRFEDLRVVFAEGGFGKTKTGVAVSEKGKESIVYGAYGAGKEGLEWTYLPEAPHIALMGDNPELVMEEFMKTRPMIEGLFEPHEKWSRYFDFYETNMIHELELETKSPLELMADLTPEKMYEPFEEVAGGGKPVMFLYRFAKFGKEIKPSIRKSVPWYDLSFWPTIENSDRLTAQLVCRTHNADDLRKTTLMLQKRLYEFLDKRDRR